MADLQQQFLLARDRSVPIIGVETLDPAVTRSWMHQQATNDVPIVQWDAVQGMLGLNQAGAQALQVAAQAESRQQIADLTTDPVGALRLALDLPEQSLVLMLNLDAFWHDPTVAQAVWNCRQPYASSFRTLVILAPEVRPPLTLTHDVIVLEEALPGREDIHQLALKLYDAAQLPVPDLPTLEKIYHTLRGLSLFACEQAISLSLDEGGIRFDALWQHKRKMIEATQGLRVITGRETLADMGGHAEAKAHIEALYRGPEPPFLIVYVEEIEKMMAGSNSEHVGDGGVAKDALQVMLTSMEEHRFTGMICVGVPGSGKSMFAAAVGATYGSHTVALDIGATRNSLVGSSERAIRACFKTIQAIGGERVYFIATSNDVSALRPELKRRYTDGIWYFGMPDDDELAGIWRLQRRAFRIPDSDPTPTGVRYTGADVRNICRLAWRTGRSLEEAAKRIVPLALSDPAMIAKLEEAADNRFLSSSYPGPFQRNRSQAAHRRALSVL